MKQKQINEIRDDVRTVVRELVGSLKPPTIEKGSPLEFVHFGGPVTVVVWEGVFEINVDDNDWSQSVSITLSNSDNPRYDTRWIIAAMLLRISLWE